MNDDTLSPPEREFVACIADMDGVPFAGNPAAACAAAAGYADSHAAAEALLATPKIQRLIAVAAAIRFLARDCECTCLACDGVAGEHAQRLAKEFGLEVPERFR